MPADPASSDHTAPEAVQYPGFGCSAPVHCAGFVTVGSVSAASVGIQTYGIQCRIDNPEGILFRENGVLIGDSRLHIVNAFHIRQSGAKPEIRQPAILADCRALEIGYEVGKRIVARIVVVLILPRETAEGQTLCAD